ncbi:MAG: hydrogenase-4 component [Planctomycetota bacterium]|nr:MAG: hydrogenase-4 component [Planctomycetota bacterium]
MLLALVLVPLILAAAAWAVPSGRVRPWIVPAAGVVNAALFVAVLRFGSGPEAGGWIVLDPLGKLVLGFVTMLYLFCSFYAPGYLSERAERPNRLFCTSMLVFLGAMSLVVLSHHMGLMWVAIETTTLASAPLIYFNHNPRSLEATWKYLLIGSVGIALALFGSFFIAYSALHAGLQSTLLFDDLVREAPLLSRPWLHAAFVLLFVGYGTKMGLAPMHTWKPDAYGEAPGLVGALLAGGLTNCAFLALLRFYMIVNAGGGGAFARRMMVVTGLVSMAVAAVFVVRQKDYKRMLAYSSVEHMGILIIGIGIGGLGVFGSLMHLVNNGLTKGVLFLTAGNIHRAYASKVTDHVSGALRRLPVSAALFMAGFFAITGSPPFGPFLSELTILNSAIGEGRYAVAALFLLFLAVIFVGMGATVFAVCQGNPSEQASATTFRDSFKTCIAPAIFLALALVMGIWVPRPLADLMRAGAAYVEGRP